MWAVPISRRMRRTVRSDGGTFAPGDISTGASGVTFKPAWASSRDHLEIFAGTRSGFKDMYSVSSNSIWSCNASRACANDGTSGDLRERQQRVSAFSWGGERYPKLTRSFCLTWNGNVQETLPRFGLRDKAVPSLVSACKSAGTSHHPTREPRSRKSDIQAPRVAEEPDAFGLVRAFPYRRADARDQNKILLLSLCQRA